MKNLTPVLVLALTVGLGCADAQSTPPSGSFGFLVNASFSFADNQQGFAILGLMNWDGAGNVTGSYTAEQGVDGNQPQQNAAGSLTGTYSTKPDGTGSITLALDLGITATFAVVMADGGQSMQMVLTNCRFGPEGCNLYPSVFSGVARAAQTAPLNGSYAIQMANAPVPSGTIGTAKFDGAGNVVLSYTTVNIGNDDKSGVPPIINATLTGTYSVNPDGTGTMKFATGQSASPNATIAFVITDKGSGILALITDGSKGPNVSSGSGRLQ